MGIIKGIILLVVLGLLLCLFIQKTNARMEKNSFYDKDGSVSTNAKKATVNKKSVVHATISRRYVILDDEPMSLY